MRMTLKLADTLMDSLCCLAISATITAEDTLYPDPLNLPTDILGKCEEYARQKFTEICDEWESIMGEAFQVETEED